jgi:hypothetical protein
MGAFSGMGYGQVWSLSSGYQSTFTGTLGWPFGTTR